MTTSASGIEMVELPFNLTRRRKKPFRASTLSFSLPLSRNRDGDGVTRFDILSTKPPMEGIEEATRGRQNEDAQRRFGSDMLP